MLLLKASISLFAGLMATRLFKRYHLPDVTAFLIAGLITGPYVLGITSIEDISSLQFLPDIALGFIAFDIGSEFRLSRLREMGHAAIFIGILQAITATLLVDLALLPLVATPIAITLGAIASATAPAATLMVVRQFKAHGPLTDLLLPIVALDDAAGLVIFAVSVGVAQSLIGGTVSVWHVVSRPLTEIFCSLILGSLMGVILSWLEKLFFSNTNRLSLTIAFILMTIALSELEIFSPLLVCMSLGTVFCNMSEYSADIMKRAEKWASPLYAVFFVISGASLNLSVFRSWNIMLVGLVYILVRCVGKYTGAYFGAVMMKCSDNVRKYLGITLFPQAGVALGMVISAQVLGSEIGSYIRNVILFSVMVYELAGPLMTREALSHAGEIDEKKPEHEHRARFKLSTKR